MKKITLLMICLLAITTLPSCNKLNRFTDSEIGAIRDQTEVLKEHNKLVEQQIKVLEEIARKIK